MSYLARIAAVCSGSPRPDAESSMIMSIPSAGVQHGLTAHNVLRLSADAAGFAPRELECLHKTALPIPTLRTRTLTSSPPPIRL